MPIPDASNRNPIIALAPYVRPFPYRNCSSRRARAGVEESFRSCCLGGVVYFLLSWLEVEFIDHTDRLLGAAPVTSAVEAILRGFFLALQSKRLKCDKIQVRISRGRNSTDQRTVRTYAARYTRPIGNRFVEGEIQRVKTKFGSHSSGIPLVLMVGLGASGRRKRALGNESSVWNEGIRRKMIIKPTTSQVDFSASSSRDKYRDLV